jgi:hypothetical protein
MGKIALLLANFQCEYDNEHETFVSNTTSNNYVEAHHIIPIKYYYRDEFKVSIDNEANIVALCPTCHRCLHYGKFEEKKIILKYLYDKNVENLKKAGIEITFDRLLEMYVECSNNQDIIFALFDGEEEGLKGSKYFVNNIKGQYTDIYDINIDCIGGKQAGKISLYNKSKISDKLTKAMRETFKENNMEFSNVELKGGTSDHRSFEMNSIPNIYIGQDNLKPYVHKETDTPDTLDFNEIDKAAAVLSNFIEVNDNKTFND